MKEHRICLAVFVILVAGRAGMAAPVVYLGADEQTGASRAVVVEGEALAHTGQVLALDKQGKLIGEGSADTQLAHALFNLETALAAGGSGIEHLVKLNVYVDIPRTADKCRKLFAKRFPGPVRPAMSWVCTPLTHPKAVLALDAVAVVPGDETTKVVRRRCKALAGDDRLADVAILPCGEAVYVSGMAERGDNMAAATAKTLESLLQAIGHLGLDRKHVVQLKAFLGPLDEADAVKQQVSKAFPDRPAPPVVLVEWDSSLPIEIEMIAYVPASKSAAPASGTVSYFTPPGVTASPVYSRLARIHGGKRIYISGLYAEEPGDGQAQVRSIFGTLEGIAKEAGTDFRHLVKATYFVADKDASTMLNKLRPEYYDPQRPPAASKAMVQGVGMSGRSITLDMIAVTPK